MSTDRKTPSLKLVTSKDGTSEEKESVKERFIKAVEAGEEDIGELTDFSCVLFFKTKDGKNLQQCMLTSLDLSKTYLALELSQEYLKGIAVTGEGVHE